MRFAGSWSWSKDLRLELSPGHSRHRKRRKKIRILENSHDVMTCQPYVQSTWRYTGEAAGGVFPTCRQYLQGQAAKFRTRKPFAWSHTRQPPPSWFLFRLVTCSPFLSCAFFFRPKWPPRKHSTVQSACTCPYELAASQPPWTPSTRPGTFSCPIGFTISANQHKFPHLTSPSSGWDPESMRVC